MLLFVLCLIQSHEPQDPNSWIEQNDKAVELFNSWEPSRAFDLQQEVLKAFEAGSEQDPSDHVLILQNLAVFASSSNEKAIAESSYLKALEIIRTHLNERLDRKASIYLGLADLYFEQDEDSKGRSAVNEALTLLPRADPDEYVALADLIYDGGYIETAIHILETVVRIHPKNVAAWRELGWVQGVAVIPGSGLVNLKKALEMDPNDPVSHAYCGILSAKAGEYQAALEHLRQAILMDPEDRRAHWELGFVYQQYAKWNDSLRSSYRALEMDSFINPEDETMGPGYQLEHLITRSTNSRLPVLVIQPEIRSQYVGSLLDNVVLDDRTVRELAAFVEHKIGIQVVVHPSASQIRLKVRAQNIPWDALLSETAKRNGLTADWLSDLSLCHIASRTSPVQKLPTLNSLEDQYQEPNLYFFVRDVTLDGFVAMLKEHLSKAGLAHINLVLDASAGRTQRASLLMWDRPWQLVLDVGLRQFDHQWARQGDQITISPIALNE